MLGATLDPLGEGHAVEGRFGHRVIDRRTFLTALGSGLLAVPLAVEAQEAGKVYRIGVVTSTAHFTHAFRQGLHELGYVEGQNVIVEQRTTHGQSDRFPGLIAEAVRLKVDVLVVSGIFGVLAAKKATTTIPIVFLGVADPVGSGIVASLARPRGNITGTSVALGEGFAGKWVELLTSGGSDDWVLQSDRSSSMLAGPHHRTEG